MGKFIGSITNNETHILSFCHVENNSWEFNENAVEFKGRPATAMERKSYNIQKGVINDDVSIYIYSSNLPEDIKPNDKVKWLGKVWLVSSVGYYFEQNKIIDSSIFDEEYIKAISPKGITLK